MPGNTAMDAAMTAETIYLRPLPWPHPREGERGELLAGGPIRFSQIAVHRRGEPQQVIGIDELAARYPGEQTDKLMHHLRAPRTPVPGSPMDGPRLMGVLNTTPDSFSDGGSYDDVQAAVTQAQQMAANGASIIDIGGESTRPGADVVPADQEIARTAPVIAALREAGFSTPISVDTRKAEVAEAALSAGAVLLNDVSALTFDARYGPLCAKTAAPICLMHAQGDPKTMQESPRYDDVLLDVYDFLEERLAAAEGMGIKRDHIIIDPGIGFGKRHAHNLRLLQGLALLHGLGCPILLGVSRKRFIGTLSGQPDASRRAPGSIAAGLIGLAQGAQILRVHDVAETAEALGVWKAATGYWSD